MSDAAFQSQLRAIVVRLRNALEGHALASSHLLRQAENNPAGSALPLLYCDQAEKIWNEFLAKHPNDWLACHHLAIMAHARAFDLELAGQVDQAHLHWIKAQKLWKQLLDGGEPLASVSDMVQVHDYYRPEVHKAELEDLGLTLVDCLLKLHGDLYNLYLSRKQLQHAELHLLAIERSPFPKAKTYFARIHEQTMGHRVESLSRQITGAETGAKNDFLPALMDLQGRLDEMLAKRPYNSLILRDYLCIKALELDISFSAQHRECEIRTGIINRLNEKMNRAPLSIAEDMQKMEEERLRGRLFTNLQGTVDLLRDCLQKLANQGDAASLLQVANTVRWITQRIIGLANNMKLENLPSYVPVAASLRLLMTSLTTYLKEPEGGGEEAGQEANKPVPEIWQAPTNANQHNPYAITVFRLLKLDPPGFGDREGLRKTIGRIEREKVRGEKLARNNKLLTCGKEVSVEDFNRIAAINGPLDLAKDLLLQHQAHSEDISGVQESLGEMALPAPEEVQLKASANIYALLPPLEIDFTSKLRWTTEMPEMPALPVAEIKWPI